MVESSQSGRQQKRRSYLTSVLFLTLIQISIYINAFEAGIKVDPSQPKTTELSLGTESPLDKMEDSLSETENENLPTGYPTQSTRENKICENGTGNDQTSCLLMPIEPIDAEQDGIKSFEDLRYPVYLEEATRLLQGEGKTGINNHSFYFENMQKCMQFYRLSGNSLMNDCGQYEKKRLLDNTIRRQTKPIWSTQGFLKSTIPTTLMSTIHSFIREQELPREVWQAGVMFTNPWITSSDYISILDAINPESRKYIENDLVDHVREMIRDWIRDDSSENDTNWLTNSLGVVIGVRILSKNAIIIPHVTHPSFTLGAIIQVESSCDGPCSISWELHAHDGSIQHLILEDGNVLLIESGTIVHGITHEFQGDKFAMVEIYFSTPPSQDLFSTIELNQKAAKTQYDSSRKKSKQIQQDVSADSQDYRIQTVDEYGVLRQNPLFILKESQEYILWHVVRPRTTLIPIVDSGRGPVDGVFAHTNNSAQLSIHRAAALGRLDVVEQLVKKHGQSILTKRDENGWQPLHEAARSGQTHIIAYLLEKGVPVNVRTNRGNGGTALYLAKKSHGVNHESVKLLQAHGGIYQEPNFRF